MNETNKNVEENDDFTSTKGSGESWNPKAKDKIAYAPAERTYDAVAQPDHKEKDIFIGYLVDIRHGIGEHKSTVYTFVPKNDLAKKVDVWGDTVLNKEIEKVPAMNILVKLEWLGQGVKKNYKEGQKGAGFNKWFVGFKTDAVLPGKTADKVFGSTENSGPVEKDSAPVKENKATENKVAFDVDDNSDLPF